MPGIGLLDGIGAGPDLQHKIDDLGQWRIEHVRTMPAAPADMVTDPIFGQPLQGMVQGIDPDLGPAPVLFHRATLGHDGIVFMGEHGIVHLQIESGLDYRPVFLALGVGDGEHQFLVRGIVLILQPDDAGRRNDR